MSCYFGHARNGIVILLVFGQQNSVLWLKVVTGLHILYSWLVTISICLLKFLKIMWKSLNVVCT